MIAASTPILARQWNTVSFASTLYLFPILDLLLEHIPQKWQPELRLGLQEALVNAAKHGNCLDPNKTIWIQFSLSDDQYWWVISDQGDGFTPPECVASAIPATHSPSAHGCASLPFEQDECGRGLFILNQIFDKVQWNAQGTELRLCKELNRMRSPLIA